MSSRVESLEPRHSLSPASKSNRTNKRVEFTCGSCGRETSAYVANTRRPTWTGLCIPCVRKRFSRKIRGDGAHSSGTIIHWSEREAGKLAKVAITCHKCQQKSFQWFSWIKDPRWQGLCHDCVSVLGNNNPRKIVQDEILPSGSVIHWSERDKTHVPVTCALGAHRWLASQAVVRTLRTKYRRQDQTWPGYCPTHRRNTAALTALLLARVEMNPQLGTTVERKRGRKPGTHGFDRDRFLAEVRGYVWELWKQHGSVHAITREAVAAKFQAKGEDLTSASIKKRLRICDITTAWPIYRESILAASGEH